MGDHDGTFSSIIGDPLIARLSAKKTIRLEILMCDSTGRRCSEDRPSLLDESRPAVFLFIIISSKEPHLGRSLLSCRMINVNISTLFVSELSALSKHRPPDYTSIKLKFHPYFYMPECPPHLHPAPLCHIKVR